MCTPVLNLLKLFAGAGTAIQLLQTRWLQQLMVSKSMGLSLDGCSKFFGFINVVNGHKLVAKNASWCRKMCKNSFRSICIIYCIDINTIAVTKFAGKTIETLSHRQKACDWLSLYIYIWQWKTWQKAFYIKIMVLAFFHISYALSTLIWTCCPTWVGHNCLF